MANNTQQKVMAQYYLRLGAGVGFWAGYAAAAAEWRDVVESQKRINRSLVRIQKALAQFVQPKDLAELNQQMFGYFQEREEEEAGMDAFEKVALNRTRQHTARMFGVPDFKEQSA